MGSPRDRGGAFQRPCFIVIRPTLLPPREEILRLAPIPLPYHRDERYRGSGESRPLAAFANNDQKRLADAYAILLDLLEVTRDDEGDEFARIHEFAQRPEWVQAVEGMREFGSDSRALHPDDPTLARAIHDLRGGAFQAVTTMVQLIAEELGETGDQRQLFFLVRDHLKMMRNAVEDLDPVRTADDSEVKLHDVDLITEKWDGADYRLGDQQREVHVESDYAGPISHRCMEFSAMDRVVYNLVNNATRNGTGNRIDIGIFPLQTPADDLRIVVANRIEPEHGARLAQRFGDDLDGIFESGFTTTGSGLGLGICAQFVSHAYGLSLPSEASASDYVGARVMGDRFVSWFHWPAG